MNSSGLAGVNAAVEGLTRSLALELGPKVRVNCISPSMIRTEMFGGMPDEMRKEMYEATGASLPVKRVGYPHEIAASVMYVIKNSFATGMVLDIDGGYFVRQYA